MIYLTSRFSGGGTIFELAFCIALIFILISVFSFYASKILLAAEEAALRSELSNLRLAIEVYKIRNGNAPEDLKSIHESSKYFVVIGRHDKEGTLIDPFGNAYIYSSRDHKVRSGTSKYVNW